MNYLNEDIDSLNKKLASGDLSADKLAKDTVANIKDTDKKLNAWITVLDDAKPAENLDYSKSKLAGIPIAIKDNIITNGIKTTAASHILYNYMPMYDATVISKLKKAGVTLVGKTNMDEFAMGSSTEHSYYESTSQPMELRQGSWWFIRWFCSCSCRWSSCCSPWFRYWWFNSSTSCIQRHFWY